jgi:hypothetical protein
MPTDSLALFTNLRISLLVKCETKRETKHAKQNETERNKMKRNLSKRNDTMFISDIPVHWGVSFPPELFLHNYKCGGYVPCCGTVNTHTIVNWKNSTKCYWRKIVPAGKNWYFTCEIPECISQIITLIRQVWQEFRQTIRGTCKVWNETWNETCETKWIPQNVIDVIHVWGLPVWNVKIRLYLASCTLQFWLNKFSSILSILIIFCALL